MKTCMLTDFMESMKPWLSNDYIHMAYLNENDHLVLLFKDNVQNVYRIDDCSKKQLMSLLTDLKNKGVDVRTRPADSKAP
jgi:hypothetical protein